MGMKIFPSKDNRVKIEKEAFQVGDHIINKDTGQARYLARKVQQPSGGFWTKRINSPFNSCEVYIGENDYDKYEKVNKFDPKWLKPFDRVLVRDETTDLWFASLFSHSINEDEEEYPYTMCDGDPYNYCIPFDEETKHLVGTADAEPEFYKI